MFFQDVALIKILTLYSLQKLRSEKMPIVWSTLNSEKY